VPVLAYAAAVQLTDVAEVLEALESAHVPVWVAGGWGVDLLVGRETRPHRDLDLLVDADGHDVCMATLAALGYEVETDWLPIRIEVVAGNGRWVDVHPVRFDENGRGLQGERSGEHFEYPPESFTLGHIGDLTAGCLSAERQREGHEGYELRPQDRHDLALLAEL
jgi:lincosamide nucleotidyltransferase A/C/D/E